MLSVWPAIHLVKIHFFRKWELTAKCCLAFGKKWNKEQMTISEQLTKLSKAPTAWEVKIIFPGAKITTKQH